MIKMDTESDPELDEPIRRHDDVPAPQRRVPGPQKRMPVPVPVPVPVREIGVKP